MSSIAFCCFRWLFHLLLSLSCQGASSIVCEKVQGTQGYIAPEVLKVRERGREEERDKGNNGDEGYSIAKSSVSHLSLSPLSLHLRSLFPSQKLPYDGRVDVWALGVITFRLLVGFDPFFPASDCMKVREMER